MDYFKPLDHNGNYSGWARTQKQDQSSYQKVKVKKCFSGTKLVQVKQAEISPNIYFNQLDYSAKSGLKKRLTDFCILLRWYLLLRRRTQLVDQSIEINLGARHRQRPTHRSHSWLMQLLKIKENCSVNTTMWSCWTVRWSRDSVLPLKEKCGVWDHW